MTRSGLVAAIAFGLLVVFVLIAAPVVGDKAFAIDVVHWEGSPLPPCFVDATHCGGHILGSDDIGRDLAACLIVGGGASIETALLALLIELGIAFGMAQLARYGGRVVGHIAITFANGMSALPRLPLALLIAGSTFAAAPHYIRPSSLQIAVWFGVIFWPAAFFAMHAGTQRANLTRRAVGDLMTILLVSSTVEFFGLGHQPPAPTWGNMLANAQTDIGIAWWTFVFPGVCISVSVLLLDIVRRSLRAGTRLQRTMRVGL